MVRKIASLLAFALPLANASDVFSQILVRPGVQQSPGLVAPNPSAGGAGLYRFLEYIATDSRLQAGCLAENRSADIGREVQALAQLREKLDELRQAGGDTRLNLVARPAPTARFLSFLGYEKIRERALKAGGGDAEKARRALLASAGFDLDDMVQRLKTGQDVDLSIPYFHARIPQEHLQWFREALGDPQLTSDSLLVRFLNDIRADMLYVVLARADATTRDFLRKSPGLRRLYQNGRLLWGLFNFGDALRATVGEGGNRIFLPGMPVSVSPPCGPGSPSVSLRPDEQRKAQLLCERIWNEILDCPLDDSERVVKRVFEDGRTGYFFWVLAKQPRLKQQVLLGMNLPESQVLGYVRRLFAAVRLPYADAYEQGRLGWRRLWDFGDLVAHVDVDPSTGELRLMGSPLAWHLALDDHDPIEDEASIVDLETKVASLSQRQEWKSTSAVESFLEIVESLGEARGDLLVGNAISPVEKFAAMQAVFKAEPKAVGNLSLPALFRDYERHGVAYRLLQGIPLGGDEHRVLNFLLQLHRIDRIDGRPVRDAAIKIFQSCLRILQITALNGSIPDARVTELFDRLVAVRPDHEQGFGWPAAGWMSAYLGALGCSFDGDAHGTLAVVLTGGREPVDVPIARRDEGIFYYRYDPARIATHITAAFLSQQRVSTIDPMLALDRGIHRALAAAKAEPVTAGTIAAINAALQDASEAAAQLRLPESDTLRRLVRQGLITEAAFTTRDLEAWAAVECDLQVQDVVRDMIQVTEALDDLRSESAKGGERFERAMLRHDTGEAADEMRHLADRLEKISSSIGGSYSRFLGDTLLGYLYAKDLDPRYPVKSGLVLCHCFDRPDREKVRDDNPWAEGRLVDLSWAGGRCVRKAVIQGSVDFIPFAMRGYRLGRMLDMNAAASQVNAQLDAQFSAMEDLPAANRFTDEGLQFVAGCYDIGAAALQSTDAETKEAVVRLLPDIVGRRRYAVLCAPSGTGIPLAADLTPSETYFLGLSLLPECQRRGVWEDALKGAPGLMEMWGDAELRESVRQLVGVPMVRTTGAIGLVDSVVAAYEDFEVDATGLRIVERINPRILLCVVMGRMGLPARLLPMVQPAVFDRILEGARQQSVNDWLSIEESARRVTTPSTVQEIVESLTRGFTPLLTLD